MANNSYNYIFRTNARGEKNQYQKTYIENLMLGILLHFQLNLSSRDIKKIIFGTKICVRYLMRNFRKSSGKTVTIIDH